MKLSEYGGATTDPFDLSMPFDPTSKEILETQPAIEVVLARRVSEDEGGPSEPIMKIRKAKFLEPEIIAEDSIKNRRDHDVDM